MREQRGVTFASLVEDLADLGNAVADGVDIPQSYVLLLGTVCVTPREWKKLVKKDIHPYEDADGNGDGGIELILED